MRADGQKFLHLANLLDADLSTARFALALPGGGIGLGGLGERLGLDQPEVGMIALTEPDARLTSSTRQGFIPSVFTEQSLREERGERGFPQSRSAVDEQRVRQRGAPGTQPLPRLG